METVVNEATIKGIMRGQKCWGLLACLPDCIPIEITTFGVCPALSDLEKEFPNGEIIRRDIKIQIVDLEANEENDETEWFASAAFID